MGEISIKEVSYKEYGKCVQISNGVVDLLITVDMGPRIIRYGFLEKENVLCENPSLTKEVSLGEWRILGGHRLWHSPESDPRSYVPDDGPVTWEKVEHGIRVSQDVEPWVQIKKDMEITLDPSSSKVKILHRLTNKNAWPVELAAWSLTVMAPGGKEFIPQPKRDTGLLANRVITLWPYAHMNDKRVYWGDRYITLNQYPNMPEPFKVGISNEDGWAAYLNSGNLFIKRFTHYIHGKYPDFGVSYETYTTDYMLEMESLSPMKKLNPDDHMDHVEEWQLYENVSEPCSNEEQIDEIVRKYID